MKPLDFNPFPFKPAWWLQGAHAQTLWQPLLRRPSPVPHQRQRVELPDGDFLDLDWLGQEGRGLVVLLHGLSGSSKSPSVAGLQIQLVRRGFLTVVLNFRGCSGPPNRTWRIYHSGETQDLRFVLCRLRETYPHLPLMATGFSLGGNVLLKYLGESGPSSLIDAAVACSVPLRLESCASRLDQGFSRLYRNQLLEELNDYLDLKMGHLRDVGRTADLARLEALGRVRGLKSFWDYDSRVVAPLYGFQDARDYYRQSSSGAFLNGICKPTLIIQAQDDPFMTPEVLPPFETLSDTTRLLVTARGGHVGFVEGASPLKPEYWLDTVIPDFFLTGAGLSL